MKREKYNTVQKQKIIEIIKKLGSSFSAKDIKKELDKEEKVGLTTIYRELEELENLGKIKKFYNDKNVKVYEYLGVCEHENHFYLKCSRCGKTFHVDCECINNFSSHVLKEHDFSVQSNSIFITGLCFECRGELK